MHNNDFDILLRAKLQKAKIHENAKKLSVGYSSFHIRCIKPETCNSVWEPLIPFHLSYASIWVGNV